MLVLVFESQSERLPQITPFSKFGALCVMLLDFFKTLIAESRMMVTFRFFLRFIIA